MKTNCFTPVCVRIVCSAVALLLVSLDSGIASVTVTKTNNNGVVVNGSDTDRSVNFSAADFAGTPSAITNIAVAITFSKASPFFGVLLTPGFREVGFTLTGAGISEQLIDGEGATRSFNEGNVGASFGGTVTFDQNAVGVVNGNPDQIIAGTFRPNGGNLNNFVGADGIGTWTLNISDSDSFLSSGLTVSSWSVSITSVPEPASIGLWGMAAILGAVIVFHRPRREGLGVVG